MNIKSLKTRRGDKQLSPMPGVLVIILTCMVAWVIYRLASPDPIAVDNRETFYFMAGQLTTAWLIAIGYYYNTNYGSKAKDQLLADSVPMARSDNNPEN